MRRISSTVRATIIVWCALIAWTVWSVVVTQVIGVPAYHVLESRAGYEVREYPPYLIAQISVRGPWTEALSEGSQALHAYLSGDNVLQASIRGDATLGVGIDPEGEWMAFTAPVVAQKKGEMYLVSLMIPTEYTRATIPRPNNPQIRILEIQKARVAARSFSGWVTRARALQEESSLRAFALHDALRLASTANVVQYHPSWILPFVRRNEVLIPVR